MEYSISKSVEILSRTPDVLIALTSNLSEEWTHVNEGEETWCVYDVIGHLIHGESTDWMARMDIILSDLPDKTFTPFDRFAQFRESKGKSLKQLLDEFKQLRHKNLEYLKSKDLQPDDLIRTGVHPHFGEVKLSHLLSCWTVHDLNHIAQICRVMAKQYKEAVGPWYEYLRILKT